MDWKSAKGVPLYDGDSYLVAVALRNRKTQECFWEYSVVQITEDGIECEGSPWGWDWDEVEYCIPVRKLDATLPVTADGAPNTQGAQT